MGLLKNICILFFAISISSCGGGNGGNGEEQTQVNPSLSGTWFFVSESEIGPPEYQGEHIIEERGNAVEITFCDRNTISLVREENDLYFNGAPFYLKVENSNTLKGKGDTDSVSIAEKVFERTKFQDGFFQMSSTQIGDINHNSNICADLRQGRFGCFDEPDIYPKKLTITSDYHETFVRLSIAFKEINVATYSVVDFCSFVRGSASQVYVDLESPGFESFLGQDRRLSIVDGSISVKSKDEMEFIVSGVLISNEGYEFLFTVEVDLTQPEYP